MNDLRWIYRESSPPRSLSDSNTGPSQGEWEVDRTRGRSWAGRRIRREWPRLTEPEEMGGRGGVFRMSVEESKMAIEEDEEEEEGGGGVNNEGTENQQTFGEEGGEVNEGEENEDIFVETNAFIMSVQTFFDFECRPWNGYGHGPKGDNVEGIKKGSKKRNWAAFADQTQVGRQTICKKRKGERKWRYDDFCSNNPDVCYDVRKRKKYRGNKELFVSFKKQKLEGGK